MVTHAERDRGVLLKIKDHSSNGAQSESAENVGKTEKALGNTGLRITWAQQQGEFVLF